MKHLLFRMGTNRGWWLHRADARFGHALDVHIHRESDVAVTQNRLNRFPLMLRRFCRYPISQGAMVMYTLGLEIGRGSGW